MNTVFSINGAIVVITITKPDLFLKCGHSLWFCWGLRSILFVNLIIFYFICVRINTISSKILRLRFANDLGYSLFDPFCWVIARDLLRRCSRLLLTINLVQKVFLAPLEICMIENLADGHSVFLVEVIQIK